MIFSTRNIQRVKPIFLILALIPMGILGYEWFNLITVGYSKKLGANPVQFSIQQSGLWALRFLIVGLAITPLARFTNKPAFTTWRRMIGLTAFAYAVVHLSLFIGLDLEGSLSALIREVIKRKYILLGMIGFILLIPLAITSTAAMIKRLGAKRWRQLHRVVYAAVLLGGVHFIFMVKGNQLVPKIYLGIIILLLGARFIPKRSRTLSKAQPTV
jgi:methionine sulfoxide reductase heme-binding subunit